MTRGKWRVTGTACIACGDCLPGCPADISIVSKLKQVHALPG